MGLVLTSADVGQATVPALTRATTEGLPLRKMADNRIEPLKVKQSAPGVLPGPGPTGPEH